MQGEILGIELLDNFFDKFKLSPHPKKFLFQSLRKLKEGLSTANEISGDFKKKFCLALDC
jgi:hypothetical protein